MSPRVISLNGSRVGLVIRRVVLKLFEKFCFNSVLLFVSMLSNHFVVNIKIFVILIF